MATAFYFVFIRIKDNKCRVFCLRKNINFAFVSVLQQSNRLKVEMGGGRYRIICKGKVFTCLNKPGATQKM